VRAGSTFPRLGAVPRRDGSVWFGVWAPAAGRVAVRAEGRDHPLPSLGGGLFGAALGLAPGAEYLLVLDGELVVPDPWSRWQPHGMADRSRVLDAESFVWSDAAWDGLDLDSLVLYELHVGAFSESGTFDGVVAQLSQLRELGVTAIELMPVATFPGGRNWGYDGVYTFAPHHAYGGPAGLAHLVDRAHAHGLGVVLDVVYNHVGPGNDLAAFGPFFTDRHATPWGDAIDYGDRGVREWALQNAELWIRDYHVDGLRLDATHAIFDDERPHILAELADRVRAVDTRALVISEIEPNDRRPICDWGHDAQWADAFHHVLHVLLTGENEGYYAAYHPSVSALGSELAGCPARRMVHCSQNHDQVGNRAFGDRPAPDELRLRAAALLFAPQVPLLFMGEEYGERRPFLFFTDHRDPLVAEATRTGRRREFSRFAAFGGEVPDPQDPGTFRASKLDRAGGDDALLAVYRHLIALRPQLEAHVELDIDEAARFLVVRRGRWELQLNFSAVARNAVPPRDFLLVDRGNGT
jgi:maltooligosyltrehalose trehalohydrolase